MLADGAIRSGKTVSMILSFLLWSLSTFHDRDFIIAGVTGGALRRNVLTPCSGCWKPTASRMSGSAARRRS